ncbi:superinfection immunity protein [Brucella pseudogrignonensis]|uniref:superinfection immunity protein n=1 Tax=Brucella pseudogrignonensis TaxID=419475 RepID=UPI000CFBCCC0|nr:superinfection immunity protein [Brucella pseudogrignonensis]MQP40968.1 superinfection immunity protein [Ochrobactrum sp. MYb237]PQZ40921.1 hypothetical protein CQ059_16870 [Brucella pseudogrignonensis]PRA40360.1 hypothetical protein CQ063_12285 [Brucella pseudogrignonensis]PRA68953.1 hypothetical protein CQ055_12170 [Brucella pseudogrignonensis]
MGEFIRKLQRLLPRSCIAVTSCLILPSQAWAAQGAFDSLLITLAFIVLILVILLVAFIPTIVAFRREHPNRWLIFVVNLAFGGTVVGWVAALVWALHYAHISEEGSNGGESGINLFVNDPVAVRVEPDFHQNVSATSPAINDEISSTPSSTTNAKAQNQDAISALHRLNTLFESGAITADEYTALKAPTLNRYIHATE